MHKMAESMQHLSANTTMHVISSSTRASTESDALKKTAGFPPPHSCSKHVGSGLYSFHLFPSSYLHQQTLASASTSTLNILLEKFNLSVNDETKELWNKQSTPVLMLKLFSQRHTTLGVLFMVFFLELLTNIVSYSMSQFT